MHQPHVIVIGDPNGAGKSTIAPVVNDPIATKLRDGETVERLVRKAIADAVEKARKLGFLDEKGLPFSRSDSSNES